MYSARWYQADHCPSRTLEIAGCYGCYYYSSGAYLGYSFDLKPNTTFSSPLGRHITSDFGLPGAVWRRVENRMLVLIKPPEEHPQEEALPSWLKEGCISHRINRQWQYASGCVG
jgi:hypothetical protein